ATMTLDPATAHPQILVSSDCRTAGHRQSVFWLPYGIGCVESLHCVLGRQGFVGGRHCWVVEIHPGPYWALGVAQEYMFRK
ncbi:BT1A1 protein, partial [Notiomystis cincta]|nr:BT1A1 protein [Notiomystis cincta]